ncbi:MAG: HU family DNA-binding protein [Fusobacterium sp.]|uniref:HU family DNA-binding protein n=1 Tax=Fusobacterium sp. SB021 TaxID=2744227 RepID=UPI001E0E5070|nr:HU family DNA-binding protein [Fusobacterium sp.]
MVKKEFIELYYNENNTSSREEAKKQVDMFLKTMEKALMQNETIIFRGLGTFTVKTVQKKNPVNPKTHEPVETAPRTTVRFKCGKKMETLLAGRKRSRKRK